MQKQRINHFRYLLVTFLFTVSLGPVWAADRDANVVLEGIGKIVGGNTVKARKAAVEGVMKQAMEGALQKRVAPGLRTAYQEMISTYLVGNYNRYVKNYRIRSERAEGAVYRVRASVVLDEERITDELKNHGFVKPVVLEQTATPPITVMFIADRRKKGEEIEHRTWWTDTKLQGGYAQDNLRARLSKVPMKTLSRKRTNSLITENGMTPILERMRQAGFRFNQTDLLELSDKIGATYLVFGVIENDFAACNLVVMQVEQRKKIGQLKLSDTFFEDRRTKDQPGRLDAISYELLGLIFRDWVKKWEADTRLTASFYPVTSIARYRKILSTLGEFKEISEVQESVFAQQKVELRFKSRLSAKALSKKLARNGYFRRKADIKSAGPRALEAVFR